jgi:hypothetical protein
MHEDARGEFYEMIDVLRGAAKQSQWQGYKDAGRKSAPSTRERAAWPRREPRQPLSALGSATLRARSLDRRSARRVVNCVACQGFLLAWHCRATSRQQENFSTTSQNETPRLLRHEPPMPRLQPGGEADCAIDNKRREAAQQRTSQVSREGYYSSRVQKK